MISYKRIILMTAKPVSIKRPEYKSNKDHVFQISALATFLLLSNDCSILLRNGVHEPLTHACTNLKSLNEICVLSQVITI